MMVSLVQHLWRGAVRVVGPLVAAALVVLWRLRALERVDLATAR